MKIMRIREHGLTESVQAAVSVLKSGGIVVYPTETFYGMGVRYDDNEALSRLYEVKRRPVEKAMPVIIGHKAHITMLTGSVPKMASALMDRFWPGPLTILLPAISGLSDFITGGTGKVAVRVPHDSFALAMAWTAGFPVTATSANISGSPPADDAGMVEGYFSDTVDLLVDGGKTPGERPSTIVDATGSKIELVRPGAISIDAINSVK